MPRTNMTKEMMKAKKEAYKAEQKANNGIPRMLTDDESLEFYNNINLISKSKRQIINNIINHSNYQEFQSLDNYSRAAIAKENLNLISNYAKDDYSLNNERLKHYLEMQAGNPGIREAVTIMKHTNPEFKKMDEFMSQVLMKRTLDIPTDLQRAEVLEHVCKNNSNEESKLMTKNLESQKILAKTLLMAHLSKYEIKNNNNETINYDGPISETFVHGGRTNFILPHGEKQQQIMDSIYGVDSEEKSGFKRRSAASHHAVRREVDESNNIVKESVETKASGAQHFYRNHFGMNIAAGGYGSKAGNNTYTTADGTSGHMYCRKELGDKNHCGSLLVGFESAEDGKVSTTGHSHNMLAKSAKQSAFLADKNGVGKKHSGRTVDLSGLDPELFIKFMENFDKVYGDLQKQAAFSNDQAECNQARQKLSTFNDFLAGKRLEPEQMKKFMFDLGLDTDLATKALTCGRKGLEARTPISQKPVIESTKEERTEYFKKANEQLTKLGIKIDNNESLKRINVMEKVNGQWTVKPLFNEANISDEMKYSKLVNALEHSNATVFAYAKGSTDAIAIENGKNGIKVENKSLNNFSEERPPKPLSATIKFLRVVSFGIAYRDEAQRYEDQLKQYNESKQKNEVFQACQISRIKEASSEISNTNRIPMGNDPQFIKDISLESQQEKESSMEIGNEHNLSADKNKDEIQV